MKTKIGYWLCVKGSDLYLPHGELPFGDAVSLGFADRQARCIGTFRQFPVYLLAATQAECPDLLNLRSQLFRPEEERDLLHKAVSLSQFFTNHRLCGRCGQPLSLADDELALHCQACQHRLYPTISPCIIVAVRKGRQILLANHLRHQKENIYTVLAGFVEVGESVENAVMREVWEETQIRIKNLRYVGSQPWAFGQSLMLGFLADYESGEICWQPEELCDARWFDCDQTLPTLPIEGTIALKLINMTLERCRQSTVEKV